MESRETAATRNGILDTKQQHWFPKKVGIFRVSVGNQCCCLILKLAFSVFAGFVRFDALHSAVTTAVGTADPLGIALGMIPCDTLRPMLAVAQGMRVGGRDSLEGGGGRRRREERDSHTITVALTAQQ